jgi:LPS export ABC transporter protein LptC
MRPAVIVKYILLLVAFALAMGIFFWPAPYKPPLMPALEKAASGAIDKSTITATSVLVAPRYTGRDSKGTLWEVEAENATQSASAENGGKLDSVLLTKAKAKITPVSASPLTFSAATGEYSGSTQHLDLSGGVVVQGQGLELATEKLSGNFETGTAESAGEVTLKSGFGTLSAGKMIIENDARIIRFENNVSATFFLK